MSADSGVDEALLKGWRKHYNSYTLQGRANVAASTIGMLGLGIFYLAFIKKKSPPKPVAAKK